MTMLRTVMTTSFRRDFRRCVKRGLPRAELESVAQMIAEGGPLPPNLRDHPLEGAFLGCRECHIRPDWLLIYRVDHGELLLILTRTGTHADLFAR